MRLPFFLALFVLSGCAAFADGTSEGRRGMELFDASEFVDAASAFQEGLDATEGQTGWTREALFMDLGLARFADSQFTEAAESFSEALALAETPARRAAAAYNAGTAWAKAEDLEQALIYLRRALIAQAEFPEARFNYEVVKRHSESSQPQDGTPPEPSAFAEDLKARADSLIASHHYAEAASLMTEGLLQDSTVAAYSDFMQRLDEVVEIEAMAAPVNPDSTQ